MITATEKAATKKRIEDALAAIATLRNIAKEAAEAEDFITLNVIGNDPSEETPLNIALCEASEALDKIVEADEEHSKYNERDFWEWWTWAYEQFPDIEPFRYMATTDEAKLFAQENNEDNADA